MRTASLICAAALCLPLALLAQKETFDIATFQPPAGWQRIASPGVLSCAAAPGPAGVGQIWVFPSRAASGTPAAEFLADWDRLVTKPLGPVEPPQMHAGQRPDGWSAVTGGAAVTRQGATFTVLLVTVSGFGRAMSFVATVAGGERLAEANRFFTTLELQSPAAAASPVNGLFVRLRAGVPSGARLQTETRFFLNGNRITRTFPFGGGDSFDAGRCNPDTCGSYQLGPGQMAIRWDNGRVERIAFEATAEGITLDGQLFQPARAISAEALAGEWLGGGDTRNAFGNTYRFGRDGSFTFSSGSSGVRGRWRVQGLALLLQYADGTESRKTLFAAGGAEPLGLISVESEVYVRR